MSQERDIFFMGLALEQAKLAALQGEVPVGAVLVLEDQVLASGFNQPITHSDPSAHAEMMALRSGATKLSNYRLPDTTLYVTLEPCAMCCGAILHARVKRVVFGAFDPKTGTAGSVTNLFALEQINHHTEVHGGVLADECGQVLRHFFKERRA
ncbi:MAG: tRNA adenosine(34) deaminase TadA [Polynucleobacter sp.]|jgi:tRNA(adenine34) deaminase|nr:tRNA adenosine(34) deaminase TadA [Polynucleobacter sp.]